MVDSGPPASVELPSRRAAAELGEQQRVVGEIRDLVALLAPGLQRVGDVAVEPDGAQLVALAVHAQVHRAALGCLSVPGRTGRLGGCAARGSAGRRRRGLDDREVADGSPGVEAR